MTVQIQQYQQTQTPQGSTLPTQVASPGKVIGQAIAGLGRNVSGLASDLDAVADRKAQVEAGRILADAEVLVSEQLMTEANALGDTDPTGFAGKFNESMKKVTAKVIERGADNPYLSGHLKLGAEKLQRGYFVQAMKSERDATTKFSTKQAGDIINANAKLAAIDPSRFAELSERTSQQIDAMPGVPAAWKAEVKTKAAAGIAQASIVSIIEKDPIAASKILADSESPITKALDADAFISLKDKADGGAIDMQGRTEGRAIAAKAFRSGGLVALDAALDKIKDEKVRDSAAKYAKAEYSMLDMQKNELERKLEEQAFNVATDAANTGVPLKLPAGMSSTNIQKATEYYLRLVEQKAYQAKGGALTSDPNYVDELQAMLYANDKTPYVGAIIDVSRLSERDARTFKTAQAKLKGDRTTKVSEVGPYIDRAMTEQGLGKTEADKRRTQAWKAMTSDRVMQLEDQFGRPLSADEMGKVARDAFSQTMTDDGWFRDTVVPTVRKLDPAMSTIISGGLKGTSVPITPDKILDLQKQIADAAPMIAGYLEAEGRPVTQQEITRWFMEQYAIQNKRAE